MSDKIVEEEFAGAAALIFPGLDDFGITPVEAMASGTPVIAYKAGGALDYIRPGVTGQFFDRRSIASLAKVLKTFDGNHYSSAAIRGVAQRFSKQAFQKTMADFIQKSWQHHSK